MAKGKGGGNNYRPIKNPELLGGQKDNRTPQEQVAAGIKPEVKKEDEKWVQTVERNPQQFQSKTRAEVAQDALKKRINEIKESKAVQQKDKEKDIDQDKDF